jgi:hypothetical protein
LANHLWTIFEISLDIFIDFRYFEIVVIKGPWRTVCHLHCFQAPQTHQRRMPIEAKCLVVWAQLTAKGWTAVRTG